MPDMKVLDAAHKWLAQLNLRAEEVFRLTDRAEHEQHAAILASLIREVESSFADAEAAADTKRTAPESLTFRTPEGRAAIREQQASYQRMREAGLSFFGDEIALAAMRDLDWLLEIAEVADTGRAQDQRAEFEAWAVTRPKPHFIERTSNGEGYRLWGVQLAWEARTQARKAQEPQLAGALEWRETAKERPEDGQACAVYEVGEDEGYWVVVYCADAFGSGGWSSGHDWTVPASECPLWLPLPPLPLSGDGTRQGEEGASDDA